MFKGLLHIVIKFLPFIIHEIVEEIKENREDKRAERLKERENPLSDEPLKLKQNDKII